ncbi:MAG TPA: hypothetical protein VEA80_15275 [Vitreimonas sp.]|uniref:hypothetical protein n=1 Tax=Vitreimonas sp. TaxID=3069702 RepID=UPI002D237ADA|nr:hypothetical protein [Vitreimonas sp.]HYD88834.1 hypothetical protein [Vitreimonas sp.]
MRLGFFALATVLAAAIVAPAAAEPTAHLGLEFAQGGTVIHPVRATDARAGDIYEITLRPEAFEIRLPSSIWSNRRDGRSMLIIAASIRPDFLNHLRTGVAASDADLVGPSFYYAMAWDPKEPGELFTAERPIYDEINYGNNWIGAHRFVDQGEYQTLRVTSLIDRDGLAPLLNDGTVVTIMFYLDQGLGDPPNAPSQMLPRYQEDDLVHAGEIDVVRITFAGARD